MSIVMQINPFDYFADNNGDALNEGYVWIGEPNKDPRQFPVSVYFDAALTIPAAQPLRTNAGYIVRANTPTTLYISGNYSVLVETKTHLRVFYVADFLMTGSSNILISLESIKDIATQKQDQFRMYYLKSYHAGMNTGSSAMAWDPSIPRSKHNGITIFSPTVPSDGVTTNQSTIVSYISGYGEIAPSAFGCFVRLFDGPVHMECGGVLDGVECGLLAQAIVNTFVPSGQSLRCDVSMTIATTIDLPQYRTDPAVSRDLNLSRVDLRKVTFTALSGIAFKSESSTARLSIGRLIGPGADAGITKGVYITGQGANIVDVGMVSGFQNDIEFNKSYANTLIIGWWDDSIRGIALYSSNDNRIKAGRVGGRYSNGIPPLDSTTCEIGIYIDQNCAHNNIDGNVEYCRRSNTSVGIQDLGYATQYRGYIESCRAYNIYASGKNGNFKILAGGTVLRSDGAGFFCTDTNNIFFTTQIDYYNEVPDGINTTLTFQTPQFLATSGTGRVHGPNGMETIARNSQNGSNLVLDSCSLGAGSWSNNTLGSASWAGVTSASSTSLPDVGYLTSTQLLFPALGGDTDIYRKNQVVSMISGLISFGCFAMCVSGDVDIMIRIIKSDGTVQHRHIARLQPSTNFQKIGSELQYTGASDPNAIYEISFRSASGANVYVTNCYFMNKTGSKFPPANIGPLVRGVITGEAVSGKAFYNGIAISGAVTNSYSPKITSTVTLGDQNLDYPIYIVSANVTPYNILLVTGIDGQIITIKRDGTAGTVNLLPSLTTIDGSTASISLSVAWSVIKIQYSAVDGWLRV